MSNLPHTVKRSVVLDASPADVWDALTDERLLAEWLAEEVELDPREGGELICRYGDGEERRGEVELVEEAERLAFSWWREGGRPSRVEFLVDAVADGTRLTVVETSSPAGRTGTSWKGLPVDSAAALWTTRLGSLRRVLRLVPA